MKGKIEEREKRRERKCKSGVSTVERWFHVGIKEKVEREVEQRVAGRGRQPRLSACLPACLPAPRLTHLYRFNTSNLLAIFAVEATDNLVAFNRNDSH